MKAGPWPAYFSPAFTWQESLGYSLGANLTPFRLFFPPPSATSWRTKNRFLSTVVRRISRLFSKRQGLSNRYDCSEAIRLTPGPGVGLP